MLGSNDYSWTPDKAKRKAALAEAAGSALRTTTGSNMPPELEIVWNRLNEYGVRGWPELDMWGEQVDTVYQQMSRACKEAGIGEHDRLKMLVAVLLQSRRKLLMDYTSAMKRLGFPEPVSAQNEKAMPRRTAP